MFEIEHVMAELLSPNKTCPPNQVAIPKKRAQFGAANQSKALAKFHATLYRAIQTHVDFKQARLTVLNIFFLGVSLARSVPLLTHFNHPFFPPPPLPLGVLPRVICRLA